MCIHFELERLKNKFDEQRVVKSGVCFLLLFFSVYFYEYINKKKTCIDV